MIACKLCDLFFSLKPVQSRRNSGKPPRGTAGGPKVGEIGRRENQATHGRTGHRPAPPRLAPSSSAAAGPASSVLEQQQAALDWQRAAARTPARRHGTQVSREPAARASASPGRLCGPAASVAQPEAGRTRPRPGFHGPRVWSGAGRRRRRRRTCSDAAARAYARPSWPG